MPKNLVLEVGYVGTRGTRLAEGRNINRAVLASPRIRSTASHQTARCHPMCRRACPTRAFLPTGVSEIETYGFSMYNSLQATLKRQMSHGLYVQGAYTWSKAMTTVYGGDGTNGVFAGGSGNSNDPKIRSCTLGTSRLRPHQSLRSRLRLSVPQAGKPVIHSREWRRTDGSCPAVDVSVRQAPHFHRLEKRHRVGNDGKPRTVSPGMGNGNIINKNGGTMLNRVKNNTYLNAANSVFGLAPPVPYAALNGTVNAYDFGNSSIGAVRGPGNDNWDMAIIKTTRVGGIHESATLDFRTEFFNAWNHPEYSAPSTAVNATTYGQITSSVGSPRLIQFALKYAF